MIDIYDKMFGEFQISAYRIETLPIYHIEGGEWEEFEQYKKGISIHGFANQDWIEQLAAWNNSGKEIKRIRIVPEKFTEYLNYEFGWCYPKNCIAGEEIRVVDHKTYKQLVTPETEGDFWLFDNKHVLQMSYDKNGRYFGEKLVNEQNLINKYIDLWVNLEEKSIPYKDFWKSQNKGKNKNKIPAIIT